MLRATLFSVLAPVAMAQCLANGTLPSNRKNLVNPSTGETYPLGFTVASWAAARATTYMASILVQDMLGFNVTYSEPYAGQIEAYYSIASCTQPSNVNDRGCGPQGPNVSYMHVQMEAWSDYYAETWDEIQSFPTAPKVLSSMGYDGSEGIYFSSTELDAAHETEGLVLDYYTGFDATWNEAWKYFDNPAAVNKSEMKPCSETNFANDRLMSTYLHFTGDTAGVQILPNGKKVAVCEDDYFFIMPACRSNSSRCIICITGGQGYGTNTMSQKAVKWNMPLALGVAKSWGDTPRAYKSVFYWWVPDTTFLTLSPVETMFPDHDKQAWLAGDVSTAGAGTAVTKLVSGDLKSLSARIEKFIDNLKVDMDTVNQILLEQLNTGEEWEPLVCRWLQNNEKLWLPWLPDDTTCFAKFGMYNTITQQFVSNRDDKEGLSCRACPSGTYSKQLTDQIGTTYICEACPAGTSQPSGAALACEPCVRGEHQDMTGQQFCNRCELGFFQDEEGNALCKQCPANSGTLQKGSFSFADCGCDSGYINVATAAGELICRECLKGLRCPPMGNLNSFLNGTHPLGDYYVPSVHEGFFTTEDEPLEVYRCGSLTQCPGGLPNQCSGGLIGVPCGECPEGFNMNDGKCSKCEDFLIVFWALGTICVFLVLTAAYYLMTSKVTAKASVLFTTTCGFGMLISLLQSIGIIGTMTIDFPVNIDSVFGWFSILLLDLDNFGFACLAGSNTSLRYSVAALFFPAGIAWFMLNYGVSQLVPKHRWDMTKVASCMGQFLQVGFATMTATALVPFTCYTHPNGQKSLLKYPNVICGSAEHGAMFAIGTALLAFGVIGFLALCSYAAYMVPMWSAREQHGRVRAFRFLVFRFRLDSWWFGVPLLTRGPLIALPVVLATDWPALQTIWVTLILLSFLAGQALAWPWKVPLLNALDCWMSYCIMILVAASALFLEPIKKRGTVADFVDTFNHCIMVVLFSSLSVMIVVALCALLHRTAMGGSSEYAIFNLGRTPNPEILAKKTKDMAELLTQMDPKDLEKAFDSLAVFDTRRIMKFMTMMSAEVVVTRDDLSFGVRVSSASFGPGAKAKGKKPEAAK